MSSLPQPRLTIKMPLLVTSLGSKRSGRRRVENHPRAVTSGKLRSEKTGGVGNLVLKHKNTRMLDDVQRFADVFLSKL
jgi:hypothetical protein